MAQHANRQLADVLFCELQDKLDFTQALIEVSLQDASRFLSLFPEPCSKEQQAAIIKRWMEKEPFPVQKNRRTVKTVVGWKNVLEQTLPTHLKIANKQKEFQSRWDHFKQAYALDKQIANKTLNFRCGMLGKPLSVLLENDADFACFILLYFSEDLPAIYRADKLKNLDLIAKNPIRLLGDDYWTWIQALFELRHPWEKQEYPILKSMTPQEKAVFLHRQIAYDHKTMRLSREKKLWPYRPDSHLNEANKQELENNFHDAINQLERARNDQTLVSIKEILNPYITNDGWFARDFFLYLLDHPLSFWGNRTQIPGELGPADILITQQMTPEELLQGIDCICPFQHQYKAGEASQEDYAKWLTFFRENGFRFLDALSKLTWQCDRIDCETIKPFQDWISETSNCLQTAIKTPSRVSIKDCLTTWMEGEDPWLQMQRIYVDRSGIPEHLFEEFSKNHLELPGFWLVANLCQEDVFEACGSTIESRNFVIDTVPLNNKRQNQNKITAAEQFFKRSLGAFRCYQTLLNEKRPMTCDQIAKKTLKPDGGEYSYNSVKTWLPKLEKFGLIKGDKGRPQSWETTGISGVLVP